MLKRNWLIHFFQNHITNSKHSITRDSKHYCFFLQSDGRNDWQPIWLTCSYNIPDFTSMNNFERPFGPTHITSYLLDQVENSYIQVLQSRHNPNVSRTLTSHVTSLWLTVTARSGGCTASSSYSCSPYCTVSTGSTRWYWPAQTPGFWMCSRHQSS